MIEKAKVAFYRVEACGYYKYGERTPLFGGLGALLHEMKKWSVGLELGDTKLFEPDGQADVMPVYLMDLIDKDGTWLMTLWNEVNRAKDGSVASVRVDSTVGDPEVLLNGVKKGTIPGFATYFWFVPDQRVFACIRFHHPISGQSPMQMYCEAYLESAASHVVWAEASGDPSKGPTVVGYQEAADSAVIRAYPRFRTRLFDKEAARAQLVSNVEHVRKVHRRTTMKLDRPDQRALWQKCLAVTGLGQKARAPQEVRFQSSITATIDKIELLALIKEWESDGHKEWDDYGFVMHGDPQVHWLSGAYARGEISLDVEWKNTELVDTAKLLANIVKHKNEFLGLLT